MKVMQIVRAANHNVIDPADLVHMPAEPLELGKEVAIREIGVQHPNRIMRVRGGHKLTARFLDGFHVPRGNEAGGADESVSCHSRPHPTWPAWSNVYHSAPITDCFSKWMLCFPINFIIIVYAKFFIDYVNFSV
jgi:hypothetical protein